MGIVGLSSPATSKTNSLNPFIPDVPASSLGSTTNKNLPSQQKFFKRLGTILEAEGVEYDPRVLVELINKHFPDWRRVLNECQRYAVGGKIDTGILATFSDVSVNDLVKKLKEKNFPEVRRWVVDNLDNDPSVLLRRVYDALPASVDGPSLCCCCAYYC